MTYWRTERAQGWARYGKNTFVEVWRMYWSPLTGLYAFIRRRIRKA